MITQAPSAPIATGDRIQVRVGGRTGTVERAFTRHDGTPQTRVQLDGDSPDRTIVFLADLLERIPDAVVDRVEVTIVMADGSRRQGRVVWSGDA
ncbi:MAG: hypothetical protein M3440_14150 [Chloroflexota bacterium]|nr:hypothetical protein [Chloroflexota bacterium]